jgi:hypothetical protein
MSRREMAMARVIFKYFIFRCGLGLTKLVTKIDKLCLSMAEKEAKKRKAARVDSFSGLKSNPIVNLNVCSNLRIIRKNNHEISHVLQIICSPGH